jgi:L-alanine-DL-glutamate epimerase-like enolase superfamily enzyme
MSSGWLSHDALKVCRAVSALDVYIEQPCASVRECATVRKHTDLPFVLDENVEDVRSVIQAWADNAADVVNIKISKFGGLTKAKQVLADTVQVQ